MEPHLSWTFEAGPFVFVSGQIARDETGVPSGDLDQQTRAVLDRISGHLERAGLGIGDVAKATIWLRRAEDFRHFNQIYADYMGEHRPARTTVVSELVLPGALVEIEAVAVRRPA